MIGLNRMSIRVKNKKIFNLLRFVGLDLWVAENEKFESYPIQFCCKKKNCGDVIKLLSNNDIVFNVLDFNYHVGLHSIINDIPMVSIFDDKISINCDPYDGSSICIMNIDEENHLKFLKLFCE